MTDPTPDDLTDVLAPLPTPPGRADARAALFARTERALARGRFLRRLTNASVVVAVFVGGALLGWAARPERVVVRVEHVPAQPEVVVVPVVVPVPVSATPSAVPDPSPTARVEPLTAARAELLAEQTDDRAAAARLYRTAGDKYLTDAEDYRNAARCYRLFLARAGDAGLSFEADDSWLLTSLKNTAFKEKNRVAKTDG